MEENSHIDVKRCWIYAWKGERLSLALELDIAAGGEKMPTILGGAVDKEEGVPWKKWHVLQMLLFRYLLDIPLEETEVKVGDPLNRVEELCKRQRSVRLPVVENSVQHFQSLLLAVSLVFSNFLTSLCCSNN